MPSRAASAAASRRAASSRGARPRMPGSSSSNTVTPSGRAPSSLVMGASSPVGAPVRPSGRPSRGDGAADADDADDPAHGTARPGAPRTDASPDRNADHAAGGERRVAMSAAMATVKPMAVDPANRRRDDRAGTD